jgi:hypothetical protein
MVPDRYPWEDDRVCTDETVVADMHIAAEIVDPVVRQDCGAEGYSRVLPDVDSPWIGLVELGAARNNGSLPNFHFPNPNEELAMERADNAKGQLITYPRR